MRQTIRHLAILLGVALVVLFSNLGSTRLWDRDEPRNAGCALEMIQRGDYMVPWFNDELRTHKPALVYWLIVSAYHIFGVNEFAARFWSAVLGLREKAEPLRLTICLREPSAKSLAVVAPILNRFVFLSPAT